MSIRGQRGRAVTTETRGSFQRVAGATRETQASEGSEHRREPLSEGAGCEGAAGRQQAQGGSAGARATPRRGCGRRLTVSRASGWGQGEVGSAPAAAVTSRKLCFCLVSACRMGSLRPPGPLTQYKLGRPSTPKALVLLASSPWTPNRSGAPQVTVPLTALGPGWGEEGPRLPWAGGALSARVMLAPVRATPAPVGKKGGSRPSLLLLESHPSPCVPGIGGFSQHRW